MLRNSLCLLLLVGVAGCASQPSAQIATRGEQRQAELAQQLDLIEPSPNYPRTTCLVTGKPLGPDRIAFLYQGREIQVCCYTCAARFRENPKRYLEGL